MWPLKIYNGQCHFIDVSVLENLLKGLKDEEEVQLCEILRGSLLAAG